MNLDDDMDSDDTTKVINPNTNETCATSESIFEEHIWPKVIEPKCVTCHTEGGAAKESSMLFSIEIDASSFETIKTFAETKIADKDGRSVLELKATNESMHGGGEVLAHGGKTHQLLVDFIGSVDGVTCDFENTDPPKGPFFSGVGYLDDDVLLRRVTLALASRIPTEDELAKIRQDPSAMSEILDGLMTEDAFITRVMDAFGDILLTDGYEATNGSVLPGKFYANANWPGDYVRNRIYDGIYRI